MKEETKGILCTITGGVCWGFSGVCGKYLFDTFHMESGWLVTVRLVIAGFVMLVVSLAQRGTAVFDVWKQKEIAGPLFCFGVLGLSACQYSYFAAIQYSNAGTATMIQYTAPVLIMVFYLMVYRRKPTSLEVAVLAMVLGGIFLLATHGDVTQLAVSKEALFWGLFSAVTLCIYNIQPKSLLDQYGSFMIVGWGMFFGGILLLGIVRPWETVGSIDWKMGTVLGMGLIILVGTVCAFSFYLEGVRLIGPVRASLFAGVEPVVAALLSACFLDQKFSKADIGGFVLILAGVTLLARYDRQQG